MTVEETATTRSRLLEAAGEEFAEKGYDAASIRKICDRVDANCAAVNYHFGSKEQLYLEALMEAQRCGTALPPEDVMRQGTPADQLRRYIYHFLKNVVAIGHKRTWHHALILREMIQPTAALEVVVRQAIRPRYELLSRILREACPAADERRIRALAFSVIGQCLHYRTCGPVNRRLVGDEVYQALDLDYVSEHISAVCLAALGLAPPLFERAGEMSYGSRD